MGDHALVKRLNEAFVVEREHKLGLIELLAVLHGLAFDDLWRGRGFACLFWRCSHVVFCVAFWCFGVLVVWGALGLFACFCVVWLLVHPKPQKQKGVDETASSSAK